MKPNPLTQAKAWLDRNTEPMSEAAILLKRLVDAVEKKATASDHAVFESELQKCADHYGYQTEEAEICNYASAACNAMNRVQRTRII